MAEKGTINKLMNARFTNSLKNFENKRYQTVSQSIKLAKS